MSWEDNTVNHYLKECKLKKKNAFEKGLQRWWLGAPTIPTVPLPCITRQVEWQIISQEMLHDSLAYVQLNFRWFYNKEAGECEEFSFSGCMGNNNRWYTYQDWKLHLNIIIGPNGYE